MKGAGPRRLRSDKYVRVSNFLRSYHGPAALVYIEKKKKKEKYTTIISSETVSGSRGKKKNVRLNVNRDSINTIALPREYATVIASTTRKPLQNTPEIIIVQ